MAEKRKRTTARSAAKNAPARKNAAPKASAKNAPARKNAAPKASAKKKGPAKKISPEERFQLIQEAAYYRAEKMGFDCDRSECWLVAEAEVDARLTGAR